MSQVKKNKKIVFDDTDTRHAKLKIRLKHDNLSQAEFFRALVTGYIQNDTLLLDFIKKYKQGNKKQSKKTIKMIERDHQKAESLMQQFGIADGELEDIFDLIENTHPNL